MDSGIIDLPVVDKDVLIFDVEVIKTLRTLGILGSLIGSLSLAPQQNSFLGLPMKLSAYEVVWLVKNGHARLVKQKGISKKLNINSNHYITEYTNTPLEISCNVPLDIFENQINPDSYRLYDQLKTLGYFLLPGLKFGGEFLAYPGDPLRYHSHLIVNSMKSINTNHLIVSGRLATGVKKLYVVSDTVEDEQGKEKLLTFSIEWAGFG